MSQRTTISDAEIWSRRGDPGEVGIFIGVFDEFEVDPKYTETLTGRSRKRPKSEM